MVYKIKSEQFEGPLDLLLQLTEEKKMDISRLSLAQIADEYLQYIEQRENISLENLSDFLSVAAKLILIKSKSLLPLLELDDEEEKEILDLEKQLAEYKKFKEISKELNKAMLSPESSYSREDFSSSVPVFYPPEEINVFDLKKTFQKILSEIPVIEKLEEEIVRNVITLEEKIEHLTNTIRERVESSFSEITKNAADKIDVIISFLAMLELVKQRIIHAEQNELFSEIKLKHSGI
jgi:segregation and condensation protein A